MQMSAHIPQNFLDDLLARSELVELIQSRVPLKKAGRNFMACCPFHHEKTPSFSVSMNKQLYHCFGCGVSGNAISFLMEYDRLDFISAVEELASRAGMEIPRDQTVSGPDVRPLFSLLARCTLFYQQQLKLDRGKQAVEYLNKRGVSAAVAKLFAIGFVPEGWDHLLKAEGTSETLRQQLVSSGMLVEKENKGYYDRFRYRIMFPIIDRRGRTIGFGGRVMDTGEPKYLNSPETTIFHKGQEVYGLYQALQANKSLHKLLVVEGYMDVVALAQFGVNFVVATLGTALTQDHIRLLYRHTGELVFCFDGDKAGRNAAWRSLETSLSEIRDGRQVKFLFLPDGEDPDTLVRKEGQSRFQQRIENAEPLSAYLLSHLSGQCEMSNIDGRAKLASLAKPLIEKVKDPIFRELLAQKIQQAVGINRALIQPEQQSRKSTLSKSLNARPKPVTPMRKAIGLLVQNPGFHQHVEQPQCLKENTEPGADLLLQLIELLRQQPNLTTASLLEHWRGKKAYQHLLKLASWDPQIPQEIAEDEFMQAFERIQACLPEQQLQLLLSEAKNRPLTHEEKQKMKNLLSHKSL